MGLMYHSIHKKSPFASTTTSILVSSLTPSELLYRHKSGLLLVNAAIVPAQNVHNFSGREWALAYIFCAVEIQTLPLEMFVF